MKKSLKSPGNKQVFKNIAILVVLAVAVYLILPQIIVIENSWQVLKKMFPWAVGLAFLAQVISYLGNGFLLQKTLKITNHVVSLLRSTLIVLGAASIGLVGGGTVGSSAAIFQWTSEEKGSVGSSTLASLIPSLFNSLMLVLFSIFGLVHLLLVHDLTQIQLIGFSITLFFLGLVIGVSILASRNRKRASTVIMWGAGKVTHLRRKPFDSTLTSIDVENIFNAWDELWKGGWHLLILGAFLNVTFDMLTLYSLFLAVGSHISFGMLLSGYALPILLGRIAFILPGGVGVIETSMAALYNSLGIPDNVAAVVVGSYRLISFWIPSLIGFPIAAYLQRSRKNSHLNLEGTRTDL